MKKSVSKKVEALKSYLTANGWVLDRFGHFKKELELKVIGIDDSIIGTRKRMFRYKFQDTSVRIERCLDNKAWNKIDGCYYKDIQVFDDGVCRCGSFRRV